MDNIMPNLTGPQATRIIRTKYGHQGMIVALTGSVLDDEVQDFKNAGASFVLAKPMQQLDLERILFGACSSRITFLLSSINHLDS
jgi:CheY-like chemotaxis protein